MEEGKGLIKYVKVPNQVTVVPPFPFRTIPLLAAAQIRHMHRNFKIPSGRGGPRGRTVVEPLSLPLGCLYAAFYDWIGLSLVNKHPWTLP